VLSGGVENKRCERARYIRAGPRTPW